MATEALDYGLIVGIDHYPGYRDLQGACADAQAFDEWLVDQSTGGGVPPENRRLILSSPDPTRPIQDDIDDALIELIELIGSGSVRRFYLYFSGHGLASSHLGADLCLAKWSMTKRNCALDSKDYLGLLVGSGKFSEIACFLDCCRVRVSNARGLHSSIGWARPADDAGRERSFVGYSTEYQNSAYEASMIGSANSQTDVRGYFTRALLEALKGKAARTGGGVPASRLKSYLESRTRALAQQDNRRQRPQVDNGFFSDNEPVFGSAEPDREITVIFTPGRYGHHIKLLDPTAHVVDETVASAAPWVLNLSEGLHLLMDEDGSAKPLMEGESDVEF